jgi:hypothetical protein
MNDKREKLSPDDAFKAFEKQVHATTYHNDMLAMCGCRDAEKLTHALFYMIVAFCLFFERFLYEVTAKEKAFEAFRKWCKEEVPKRPNGIEKLIDLEAYFNVRHSIMHLGGCCSGLHIFNRDRDNLNNAQFRGRVRDKLSKWGIDENTDLCDFSQASLEKLGNAWSGVNGYLRSLAASEGLTRQYFSSLP